MADQENGKDMKMKGENATMEDQKKAEDKKTTEEKKEVEKEMRNKNLSEKKKMESQKKAEEKKEGGPGADWGWDDGRSREGEG